MDLTKAEESKKRWQEYTELYPPKKERVRDLNDPDTHNAVIAHLKTDVLEHEVNWALGNKLHKKLIEMMEFQLSCFKS